MTTSMSSVWKLEATFIATTFRRGDFRGRCVCGPGCVTFLHKFTQLLNVNCPLAHGTTAGDVSEPRVKTSLLCISSKFPAPEESKDDWRNPHETHAHIRAAAVVERPPLHLLA